MATVTTNDCDASATVHDSVAVTWATNVQVPVATYVTTPDATVQTLVVDDVTDVVPSDVVVKVGVNDPPTNPLIPGIFEMLTPPQYFVAETCT